jgi:hypothetical protein
MMKESTYKGRTITAQTNQGTNHDEATAWCGLLRSKRFQGSSAERRAVAHVRRLIDKETK